MLPQDPVMLLSYINTELRDNYSSFDKLCSALDLDESDIVAKLGQIGYKYNSVLNQFK